MLWQHYFPYSIVEDARFWQATPSFNGWPIDDALHSSLLFMPKSILMSLMTICRQYVCNSFAIVLLQLSHINSSIGHAAEVEEGVSKCRKMQFFPAAPCSFMIMCPIRKSSFEGQHHQLEHHECAGRRRSTTTLLQRSFFSNLISDASSSVQYQSKAKHVG